MLTRLHRPGGVHPEDEPAGLAPEIVAAESALFEAEAVVRLCRLAEALDVHPDKAAQIVADARGVGATFYESLDGLLEEIGEA